MAVAMIVAIRFPNCHLSPCNLSSAPSITSHGTLGLHYPLLIMGFTTFPNSLLLWRRFRYWLSKAPDSEFRTSNPLANLQGYSSGWPRSPVHCMWRPSMQACCWCLWETYHQSTKNVKVIYKQVPWHYEAPVGSENTTVGCLNLDCRLAIYIKCGLMNACCKHRLNWEWGSESSNSGSLEHNLRLGSSSTDKEDLKTSGQDLRFCRFLLTWLMLWIIIPVVPWNSKNLFFIISIWVYQVLVFFSLFLFIVWKFNPL